jgi:hypothetical protein
MEKECIECGNEFIVSKKDIQKLIFREPDDYICMECYEERITSEHRISNGAYLCLNSKCVRNKMAFSNYCEICDRSFL